MAAKGIKGGRAVASFIIPPVGIITYFMIKDKRPKDAKKYLMLSVASLVLYAAGGIYNKVIND